MHETEGSLPVRPRPSRWSSVLLANGVILLLLLLFGWPVPIPQLRGPLFRFVVFLAALAQIGYGLRLRNPGYWSRGRLPSLGQYRVRIPTEAIVYLVILFTLFVGAMIGKSNLLLLVFGMMAGPFIINGSITFWILKRLRVRRDLPPSVAAGAPFSVDLTLTNRKRWLSGWQLAVCDQVTGPETQLEGAVLFTRVPCGSERTGTYRLRLMRRGRYQFGPVEVWSRFPLGLVERGVVLDQPAELIVYPRLGQLSTGWQQSPHASQAVPEVRIRKGTFDDEFHRLREYHDGDNPRAIHWRTSARRNELMVREFRQERTQELLLLVDLWLPSRPSRQDLDRVELAVSLAATLCLNHRRQGGSLRLLLGISGQTATAWDGSGNTLGLDEVFRQLAVAEAGPSLGLQSLADDLAARSARQTEQVLVTTRPAALLQESLRKVPQPVPMQRASPPSDAAPGPPGETAHAPIVNGSHGSASGLAGHHGNGQSANGEQVAQTGRAEMASWAGTSPAVTAAALPAARVARALPADAREETRAAGGGFAGYHILVADPEQLSGIFQFVD